MDPVCLVMGAGAGIGGNVGKRFAKGGYHAVLCRRSDDYDADLAERYGWVTRAIADAELDRFVDSMASRLASFDKQALAAAKAQVNRATLPPDADLRAAYAEYVNSLTWPGFRGAQATICEDRC